MYKKETEIINNKRKLEEEKENIENNKKQYLQQKTTLQQQLTLQQTKILQNENLLQQQKKELNQLKKETKQQQQNNDQIKLLKILQNNTAKLLTQFPTGSPLRQSFLHLISDSMTAQEAHKLFNVPLSTVKLAKKNKSKKLINYMVFSRAKTVRKFNHKEIAWKFFLEV